MCAFVCIRVCVCVSCIFNPLCFVHPRTRYVWCAYEKCQNLACTLIHYQAELTNLEIRINSFTMTSLSSSRRKSLRSLRAKFLVRVKRLLNVWLIRCCILMDIIRFLVRGAIKWKLFVGYKVHEVCKHRKRQELMSSRRLRRSVQLSISGCKSALNITANQTGPYTDGLSAQVTLPSSGSTRWLSMCENFIA